MFQKSLRIFKQWLKIEIWYWQKIKITNERRSSIVYFCFKQYPSNVPCYYWNRYRFFIFWLDFQTKGLAMYNSSTLLFFSSRRVLGLLWYFFLSDSTKEKYSQKLNQAIVAAMRHQQRKKIITQERLSVLSWFLLPSVPFLHM